MLLVVATVLGGLNGILLAFGAAGANFKCDDPRKVNAGGLGCLGQLVTIVLLGVNLALFMGPLLLATAFHLPSVHGYLAGRVLGGGATLTCALLPLRLIEHRVEHLDEA